jgi:hypothetical protein
MNKSMSERASGESERGMKEHSFCLIKAYSGTEKPAFVKIQMCRCCCCCCRHLECLPARWRRTISVFQIVFTTNEDVLISGYPANAGIKRLPGSEGEEHESGVVFRARLYRF